MSLIRIFQSSSVSSSSNGTSRSNNVITIHTFSPQYIATDIKIDQGFAFISGVYKSSSSVSGFFFDQISLNPAATTSIPLEHIVSDAQGMGLFSQSVWSIGSRKSPSMFKSSIVVCSGKVYFLLNAVAANATSPNGFGLAAYVYDATTFQQLSSSNATLVPNYDSVVSATCLDSSNIVKSSTLSTYPNQGILLLVSQVGVTVPTTPATSPNTGNDGGTGTDTALDSSSTTSVIRPEYLLFVNSSLSPSIKYQIPNAVLTSTDPSMDILMLSVQSLYNQPNISALMFAFADNQAANSSSLSTSPLLGGVYETFSFSTSIPFQSFYPSVNNCNDGYFYDNSTSQCISCTAPSRAGDVANYPSCQSYLVNPTYGASGSASSSKLAAAIIIPLMIAVVVGLYLVYLKYKAVIDPLLPSWMTSSTSREWGSPATAAAAPTMSKRNYIGGGGVGGGRGIPGNREEFADLEKAERFGQHGNDHDVGKGKSP